MRLILFTEDSSISKQIADSLKSKWRDVCYCTDRISFFTAFFDDNIPRDVILIFSESVLKDMSMTVDSFMERYDVYYPVFTFLADFRSLIIQLNYISKYAKFFSNTCIEAFQMVVECFYKCLQYTKKPFFCTCTEHKIFNGDKAESDNRIFLDIYNISDKYNIFPQLTKAQRRLFVYLLLNRDGVSKDEIAGYLWQSNLENKNQNVYVLISGLRGVLKEKTADNCTIICEHKKYKLQFLVS